MPVSRFESPLTGGHPNSLGNTVSVVDEVLADRALLAELVACYRSEGAVVRLRVSSAVKRVAQQQPEWVAAHLDDLLGWVAQIDQASTKWTLSILFVLLDDRMTPPQRDAAIALMQANLHYDDWIVQNTTADSLAHFARQRPELAAWLIPELRVLTSSRHKSVRGRAAKLLASLATPSPQPGEYTGRTASVAQWKSSSVLRKGLGVRVPPGAPDLSRVPWSPSIGLRPVDWSPDGEE